jgi:hypothetical protein
MKLSSAILVSEKKWNMNFNTNNKRKQRRFNIPVIGHFSNRSIRFNSILEAEECTNISYTLIYEACVGKIYKARNVYWEFENGAHYIRYKAHYIRARIKLDEETIHGLSKKNKKLAEKSETQS